MPRVLPLSATSRAKAGRAAQNEGSPRRLRAVRALTEISLITVIEAVRLLQQKIPTADSGKATVMQATSHICLH